MVQSERRSKLKKRTDVKTTRHNSRLSPLRFEWKLEKELGDDEDKKAMILV